MVIVLAFFEYYMYMPSHVDHVDQMPTANKLATTKGETSTPTTSGPNGTNKTATMIETRQRSSRHRKQEIS